MPTRVYRRRRRFVQAGRGQSAARTRCRRGGRSAHDPRQAGDRVRELRPDGVLLDVHLRDADGFTVVRILRRARADLHVLLTSSDAAAATPRLARQCGATGFVPKTELITTDLPQ